MNSDLTLYRNEEKLNRFFTSQESNPLDFGKETIMNTNIQTNSETTKGKRQRIKKLSAQEEN
ncbi:MAG: hypothetical protein LBV75_08875 [Paludibacter sp.]|nr:hypothetical protein [Paludibacter sp.]